MTDADMRCMEFADILARKRRHYPYSDRYLHAVHGVSCETRCDEGERIAEWFQANETKGSGAYSRQTPNFSAKRCYNRLLNATWLLWIAEAVGVDETTVRASYEAALEAGEYRRACGAIRRIIPWGTIYALTADQHHDLL